MAPKAKRYLKNSKRGPVSNKKGTKKPTRRSLETAQRKEYMLAMQKKKDEKDAELENATATEVKDKKVAEK